MKILELRETEWVDGVPQSRDVYRYICKNNNNEIICHFDSDKRLSKEDAEIKAEEALRGIS